MTFLLINTVKKVPGAALIKKRDSWTTLSELSRHPSGWFGTPWNCRTHPGFLHPREIVRRYGEGLTKLHNMRLWKIVSVHSAKNILMEQRLAKRSADIFERAWLDECEHFWWTGDKQKSRFVFRHPVMHPPKATPPESKSWITAWRRLKISKVTGRISRLQISTERWSARYPSQIKS